MASSASAHCSADGLAMAPSLRVGILGTAETAKTEWSAIMLAGLTVTRVGSRNLDRAIRFVDLCSAELNLDTASMPRIGSYDDVVTASDVDVVYIPIPVTQRDEWVKKCIANNKHVVGEKPAAESAEQLKAWIEGLHAKQLLYMDGTMLSHGAVIRKVTELLPSIGVLRRLDITCCSLASQHQIRNGIRFKPDLEPMGALGDLGWNCIRVILHVLKFAAPIAVIGRILSKSQSGALTAFSSELTFPGHTGDVVTACFYCSFNSTDEGTVSIIGSDGIVEAPNLPCPIVAHEGAAVVVAQPMCRMNGHSIMVRREEQVFRVPEETGTFQETQMWRNVANSIEWNESEHRWVVKEEESTKWAMMAWMTQSILDSTLTSAKAQYNAPS